MAKLRVAMIAPPWLSIPPKGYGGVEAVVYALVRELAKLDVDIELFSIKKTKITGIKNHFLYKDEQYSNIHRPAYESVTIDFAHLHYALNYITQDGTFDIIHDHNGFIGPSVLAYAVGHNGIPPAVHTLHGPPFSNKQMIAQGLPDNLPYWTELGKSKLPIHYVAISQSLKDQAPKEMMPQMLEPVHNAIDVNDYIYKEKKHDYFLTLARFSPDKGQHIAVKFCNELKARLWMAGTVASIGTRKELMLQFADPLSTFRNAADFKYFSDEILPYTIRNKRIQFIGNISGKQKLQVIANAKALLFPIDWEEPFGMAVIEALASGTPVVAMRRGAMPEIIEHGVTGFLADTHEEFKAYMQRVGEINPAACRASIESRFSSRLMAQKYLDRYKEVLAKK